MRVCSSAPAAAVAFHAKAGPYEVDFLIVGTPIVLKVDGSEVHARQDPAQQAHDAARDAHLTELGFVPVRFVYRQIVREPAKQARRIEGIIRRWAPHLYLVGARSRIRD